ncbi:MAG: hypothetical protein B6U89_01980 [Desulfurococcales archaeon ex4484_58]|nr:MAG: hypothetical protein B6U89_01980 [Desulfurococcales archaeon ex4484_58]
MVFSTLSGYGELKEPVSIGPCRIFYEEIDREIIVYRRLCNGRVEAEEIVSKPLKFEIIPLYPVFTPYIITKYVSIHLTQPLIVPSNSSITIYLKLPVDIGVYVYDLNGRYELIDVYPPLKVKYGVYGTVENGVIARHYISPIYRDLIKPGFGEAVAKVNVLNRFERWVKVSRIVLDSQLLRLHYIKGSWEAYTQEILFEISSPTIAYISYGSSFIEKAIPINDPEGFKPPKLRGRSEMLWGL